MATAKQWPPECKSVFTQGSCEDTNDAFRIDPFLGTHKHGPRCNGDVRAVIFPLSSQARACCKAEIRETDPSQVVSLRVCEESTYFSIGTPLTANVTLLGLETDVDDPAEWQHPIEARIYLDPDGDDAELFNASYTDNIVARSYPNGDRFVLAPEQHCRLNPNQSWALDVRYCFGLNLHPVPPHVFTPLLSDNESPSLAQIHRTFGALQHIRVSHGEARPIASLSTPVEDEHDRACMPPPRRISMTATPHAKSSTPVEVEDHRPNVHGQNEPKPQRDNSAPLSTQTVEDEVANWHDLKLAPWSKLVEFSTPPTTRARTLLDDEETGEDDLTLVSPSPSPLQDSSGSGSAVLFQDFKTIVYAFTRNGQKRVRKTIRTMTLHKAAMQWEEELAILKAISHPHVVKPIAWSAEKRSIDFEHGGKDLSKFKDVDNVFHVNTDPAAVQGRIFSQMAATIKHIHAHNIMHRDIKPHNILLSDNYQIARLCDFGHAHIGGKWRGGGTEWYIPPEVITNGTSGPAADIWALGITMLFVFKLIPLPGSEAGAERWTIAQLDKKAGIKDRALMRKWLGFVREAKEGIGEELAVLRDMLEEMPAKRITAEALVERLGSEQAQVVKQDLLAA
jgi:tRNA A-37 threonylcarbamoyl transferase component Bud32